MLGEQRSGEYIVAVANKDYWGAAKAYYSEIMFRVVPDVQTRMLLLESGIFAPGCSRLELLRAPHL